MERKEVGLYFAFWFFIFQLPHEARGILVP